MAPSTRFVECLSLVPHYSSQLLEDFLVAGSQKIEGKQTNLKDSNAAEPSQDQKSVQGTRSTARPIKAQEKDGIKFA